MTNTATGPIEVWLSQKNLQVTCRVVHEDERTDDLDCDALTMRGAQREMTGYLINQGFAPDGRWTAEAEHVQDGVLESWRRFQWKGKGENGS